MKTMHRQSKCCRELSELLYAALTLERRLVGIKLLSNKEVYQKVEAKELIRPINYCQMVASASRGNAIKARQMDIKCASGIKVLGFDHSDPVNAAGENWTRLGMYADADLSRSVRGRLSYIPEKTYGILVQPVEYFDELPDVILIVTEPYNVMRLTQGYGYHHGEAQQISMLGNQAVCLECTAAPYLSGEMNVSTLCIGTRHQAGWKDSEMAFGIAGSKFADMVDGVMATLNIMESDEKKRKIEERMQKAGLDYEPIRYHYNYYMDC